MTAGNRHGGLQSQLGSWLCKNATTLKIDRANTDMDSERVWR